MERGSYSRLKIIKSNTARMPASRHQTQRWDEIRLSLKQKLKPDINDKPEPPEYGLLEKLGTLLTFEFPAWYPLDVSPQAEEYASLPSLRNVPEPSSESQPNISRLPAASAKDFTDSFRLVCSQNPSFAIECSAMAEAIRAYANGKEDTIEAFERLWKGSERLWGRTETWFAERATRYPSEENVHMRTVYREFLKWLLGLMEEMVEEGEERSQEIEVVKETVSWTPQPLQGYDPEGELYSHDWAEAKGSVYVRYGELPRAGTEPSTRYSNPEESDKPHTHWIDEHMREKKQKENSVANRIISGISSAFTSTFPRPPS